MNSHVIIYSTYVSQCLLSASIVQKINLTKSRCFSSVFRENWRERRKKRRKRRGDMIFTRTEGMGWELVGGKAK